jgi:excisionase family DNA binding protein
MAAQDEDEGDALVKPSQVCRELGISRRTLNEWAREGRIATVRLSARVLRVRRSDLAAFVAAQTRPAVTASAPTKRTAV